MHCTFCGAERHHRRILIQAHDKAAVCERCTWLLVDILQEVTPTAGPPRSPGACCFCHRPGNEVHLVHGNASHGDEAPILCWECIGNCQDLLEDRGIEPESAPAPRKRATPPPGWDALVTLHGLTGLAHCQRLEKETEGQPWDMDVVAARLQLGGRTLAAQMLGTLSRQSNTFLWAWANPSLSQDAEGLRSALALRDRGGWFATEQLDPSDVAPTVLCAVSAELLGKTLYRADFGDGVAYLAVDHDREPLAPVTALPGLIPGWSDLVDGPTRLHVVHFLEHQGFDLSDGDGTTQAQRAQTTLTLHWGPDGRFESMRLKASG